MEQVKISFLIDKTLRNRLKVVAAKNDTTVTKILTDYIDKYVNENE